MTGTIGSTVAAATSHQKQTVCMLPAPGTPDFPVNDRQNEPQLATNTILGCDQNPKSKARVSYMNQMLVYQTFTGAGGQAQAIHHSTGLYFPGDALANQYARIRPVTHHTQNYRALTTYIQNRSTV